MKKTFLQPRTLLVLGFVLALGVSASAAWSGPTATPPGNNLDAPVHVGNDQLKQIGSTTSTAGGLSVDAFISGGTSYFDQQTFFQGTISGGTPTAPGAVNIGTAAAKVNVTNSGNVSAANYIESQAVANPSDKKLCADARGVIIICP